MRSFSAPANAIVFAVLVATFWSSSVASLPRDSRAAALAGPAAASESVIVELENLAASAAASGGDLVVQPMAGFGPGWGDDAQLFWRPPTPVEEPIRNYPHLSMLVRVPAGGTYDLVLHHTVAPDYGDFTVLVAGKRAADVRGFGPAVALRQQSLGRRDLDGETQVVFTVFGKHEASTGYVVGLDRLELRPVGGEAPGRLPSARSSEQLSSVTRSKAIGDNRAAVTAIGEGAVASIVDPALTIPPLSLSVLNQYADPVTLNYESVWASSVKRHYSLTTGGEFSETFRFRAENLPAGATRLEWQVTRAPASTGVAVPPMLMARGSVAVGDPMEFEVKLPPARRGRMKLPGRPQQPANSLTPETWYVRAVGLGQSGDALLPTSLPAAVVLSPYQIVRSEEEERSLAARYVQVSRVRLEPEVFPLEDAFRRFVVTAEHPITRMFGKKVGDKWYVPPPDDDDVWDDIGGALGSIGDFVADAADWVSEAWSDIQGALVDFVADDLLDCGEPCRVALSTGLQAGLTAIGVPPSLPNFDQFAAMGKGYLVEVVAAEVGQQTGAPREVIEHGIDQFLARAKAVSDHGASGNEWLRPDPDAMGRPPILFVTVTNAGRQMSPMWHATVDHPLYLPIKLPIPPLAPGRRLEIPVLLDNAARDYESRRLDIAEQDRRSSLLGRYRRALMSSWRDSFNDESHELKLSTGVGTTERRLEIRMREPFDRTFSIWSGSHGSQ